MKVTIEGGVGVMEKRAVEDGGELIEGESVSRVLGFLKGLGLEPSD